MTYLKQKVAKELADSGMFGRFVSSSYSICHNCDELNTDKFNGPDNPSTCGECGSVVEFKQLQWPTADESEEILAEMGLQVIRVHEEEDFCLVQVGGSLNDAFWSGLALLNVKEVGQRTLANNAALAWLCNNLHDELKAALERLGLF